MIERKPRQFLAVWSDDGNSVKGSTFEESIFVDGAFWKNELTTVPPEQFAAFGELFSSALQAQNEQLVSDHKAELDAKEAALNSANATIATLEAKIKDLEQYRPFDPRILKGEAFYERVSKDDMVTLLASDIPQLVLAGKTIEAYRKEKWPVILDSDDFKGLMAGVHSAGIFDPDELEALTRDATRDEAYGTA